MAYTLRIACLVFAVAVLSIYCDAQRYGYDGSDYYGDGDDTGDSSYGGDSSYEDDDGNYGSRNNDDSGYGYRYGGYRGGRSNQANQGGDQPQSNGQTASNINYGSGDINNQQRNQQAQSGFQRNLNDY